MENGRIYDDKKDILEILSIAIPEEKVKEVVGTIDNDDIIIGACFSGDLDNRYYMFYKTPQTMILYQADKWESYIVYMAWFIHREMHLKKEDRILGFDILNEAYMNMLKKVNKNILDTYRAN